jgi:hypothetical protein
MIIWILDHMNMYNNPWLGHDTTNITKKTLTIVSTTQNKVETK